TSLGRVGVGYDLGIGDTFGENRYTIGGNGTMNTTGAGDLAKYIGWSVAPEDGHFLNISEVRFTVGIQDSDHENNPRYELRYSVDGFAQPLSAGELEDFGNINFINV